MTLEILLKKFSSGFVIQEFHKEWDTFLKSLSKADQTEATEAMLDSILDNAKAFRHEVTQLVENGSEENRQWVLESINDLKEHPFFMRKEVGA